MEITCYLCTSQAKAERDPKGKDAFLVKCNECGTYLISDIVLETGLLNEYNKEKLMEKIKNHIGDNSFFITKDEVAKA